MKMDKALEDQVEDLNDLNIYIEEYSKRMGNSLYTGVSTPIDRYYGVQRSLAD